MPIFVFVVVTWFAWWCASLLLTLGEVGFGPVELPVAAAASVVVGALVAYRFSRRGVALGSRERYVRLAVVGVVGALIVVQVVGSVAIGGHYEVGSSSEVVE